MAFRPPSGGGGGISGPGSSTDNAVVRWDGTGGSATQNSNVIVDDDNNVTVNQVAASSGSPTVLNVVGASSSGLAAADLCEVDFDLNRTITFAGGGSGTQYTGVRAEAAELVSTIAHEFQTAFGVSSQYPVIGTNSTISTMGGVASFAADFGHQSKAPLTTGYLCDMPGVADSYSDAVNRYGYVVLFAGSNIDLGDQVNTMTSVTPFKADAITFEAGAAVTVTDAFGSILNAPVASTNVTFTRSGGLLVETGVAVFDDGTEIGTEIFFTAEVNDGNSGAADTIDWTTGNHHLSTLTDNVTYTFTAPSGPASLTLKCVQDAGGTNTRTWPAAAVWAGGVEPVWSVGSNEVDLVTFYYDGTSYIGSAVLNYS